MMDSAMHAAAAASRGGRYPTSASGLNDSQRLYNLFPAPANYSIPSSRAPSIRPPSTQYHPTRARELRPIHEHRDDASTTTSAFPTRHRPLRRRSSFTMSRQTPAGVSRAATVNLGRRGSQSYLLRRTLSLGDHHSEAPFKAEDKPEYIPASCRPENQSTLRRPLNHRTLRSYDGNTIDSRGSVSRRRRLSDFISNVGTGLVRQVSKTFGRRKSYAMPLAPLGMIPVQQVRSETLHYGDRSRLQRQYSFADDSSTTGTQYADTVIHDRSWEDQSYISSLDNQGPDYFTRPPPRAPLVYAPEPTRPSTREQVKLMEAHVPTPEITLNPVTHRGGMTPFQQPTDLQGIEPRRVYSALVRTLSRPFKNPSSQQSIVEEHSNEPQMSRFSNENVRPPTASIEKSTENRRPLSELPTHASNTFAMDDEESTNGQTTTEHSPTKSVRPVETSSLYTQFESQNIWREEGDRGSQPIALGMKSLSLVQVNHVQQAVKQIEASETTPSKLARSYSERKAASGRAHDYTMSEAVEQLRMSLANNDLQENKIQDKEASDNGTKLKEQDFGEALRCDPNPALAEVAFI